MPKTVLKIRSTMPLSSWAVVTTLVNRAVRLERTERLTTPKEEEEPATEGASTWCPPVNKLQDGQTDRETDAERQRQNEEVDCVTCCGAQQQRKPKSTRPGDGPTRPERRKKLRRALKTKCDRSSQAMATNTGMEDSHFDLLQPRLLAAAFNAVHTTS